MTFINHFVAALVIVCLADIFVQGTAYHEIGCFKDKIDNRAMDNLYLNLRGDGSIFSEWSNMTDVINQCAQAAEILGYDFFGVQFYGECWGSKDAASRYGVHGKSQNCVHGVGKARANMVYKVLRENRLNHIEVCANMVGPNTNMSAGFSGKIITKTNELKRLCDQYMDKLKNAEDPSVLEEDLLDLYDDITAEMYCMGHKVMNPNRTCDSSIHSDFDTSGLVEGVKQMDKAMENMTKECDNYETKKNQSADSGDDVGSTLTAAEEMNKCFCTEEKKWCGRQMRNLSKSAGEDISNLFYTMNAAVDNPFPDIPDDNSTTVTKRSKLPLKMEKFGKLFGCSVSADPLFGCVGVSCTYPPFGPAIDITGSYCVPAELNVALSFCIPPISDFLAKISYLPHVGKVLDDIGISGGCLMLGEAVMDLARGFGSFFIGPKLDLALITITARMEGTLRFGAPSLPSPGLMPCSRMELDEEEDGQNHLALSMNIGVSVRVPYVKWCWWGWVPYPCGGGFTEKQIVNFNKGFTHRFSYRYNNRPYCHCCKVWPNWGVDYHHSDPICAAFC